MSPSRRPGGPASPGMAWAGVSGLLVMIMAYTAVMLGATICLGNVTYRNQLMAVPVNRTA